MDATLNEHAPFIGTPDRHANLNNSLTHVAIVGKRGFETWRELPEDLQAQAAEWAHAENMAFYGDDWRADRADALEGALVESILEWLGW